MTLRAEAWQGRRRVTVTTGEPSYFAGVLLLKDEDWEHLKATGGFGLILEDVEGKR